MLVLFLAVEVTHVFNEPKVAAFIFSGSCILDSVKRALVVTCRCGGLAPISPSALEALLSVSAGMFLTTNRLDAGCIKAVVNLFQEHRLNMLLSELFCKRLKRY